MRQHKPLLCVTVTADTTAELRARRDEVVDADLVELRLDSVRDPSAAGALAGRRRPVIVTCRPAWEGGRFTGSEEERQRILGEALALGADYIDVEWRARFDDLIARTGGRGVIISSHDFDGVPADLMKRASAMRSSGADIVKVAVKANRLSDCVPLLEVGERLGGDGRLVVIAMGPHGIATRALPRRFGSRWTYAGPLETIGQVSARTLIHEYRFRSVTESTAIYGVVGGSVAHSVSPAMHNAAFDAAHLHAIYLPFPAVDAEDFHTFGRAIGVAGASVTIPHKVSLVDRVDEVYPVARRIGAINTVRVIDGRWIGDNTDANGFLTPLQERITLRGQRVSVIGAGGAARAVTVALASTDCTVRVHARRREQAEEVAVLTPAEVGPWPPEQGSWDVLVNCTPSGMYPHVDETPIPASHLTGRFVYDLVYNPPTTRLMHEAAAAGCQTMSGLEMLVAQAEAQFQWWTGRKSPKGVMRNAATGRLSEFARDEDYVI